MSFDLETAREPERLRRVVIDPVSRVEGHGKVTILLDDDGRVHQVRLHIVEFRGFERFIRGRPYWEVPVMVQRLCGICPVSHHLAASKALDAVVGARPVTPTAQAVRRLMHYGQIVQSHALHFFHLASPDLLFGFDSDVARRNIVGVAAAHPEIARQGVLIRRFGQEVIRVTAGKRIHGTGSVPGGVNKVVSREDRDVLAAECDRILPWCEAAVGLARTMHLQAPALYDGFGTVASKSMSLVAPDGGMDLYDGVLRVRGADGAILFDGVAGESYLDLLEEEVRPWSYMKFPYLKDAGPQDGWYRVGPLSRVQNCERIPTPRAQAAREAFLAHGAGKPIHAPLATHWARMIEMLHAAERVRELLDDERILAGELMAQGPRRRVGIGVIEAPRGTLIHHYEVGDDDLIEACNLIVSTTHNNQAMNEAIREVARRELDGRKLTEGLLNHVEVAIRAFDPCLSCATHALGQMPLAVEVVGPDGERLDAMVRTAQGSVSREGA
ncbi:MAG: Ni/Fe hydrogenase subunit alpha [Burkholderiaceae bacterium]